MVVCASGVPCTPSSAEWLTRSPKAQGVRGAFHGPVKTVDLQVLVVHRLRPVRSPMAQGMRGAFHGPGKTTDLQVLVVHRLRPVSSPVAHGMRGAFQGPLKTVDLQVLVVHRLRPVCVASWPVRRGNLIDVFDPSDVCPISFPAEHSPQWRGSDQADLQSSGGVGCRARRTCRALLEKLKREQETALRTRQFHSASCPICMEEFAPDGAPAPAGASDPTTTAAAGKPPRKPSKDGDPRRGGERCSCRRPCI